MHKKRPQHRVPSSASNVKQTPVSASDAISFVALQGCMSAEFRHQVVKEALGHRSKASQKARTALDEQLTKIQVPGFRSGSRVNKVELLLPHVVQATLHSGRMMGAILLVWQELHANLCQLIDAYLQDEGFPIHSGVRDQTGFAGMWPPQQMEEMTQAFLVLCPSYPFNDAALMMCCQSGYVAMPDVDVIWKRVDEEPSALAVIQYAAGSQATAGMKESVQTVIKQIEQAEEIDWQPWLRPWLELPVDAAEWNGLDVFIVQLHSLAAAKQAAKTVKRDQLRLAIETVGDECRVDLDSFELSVETWDADTCPLADAEMIAERIQRYQDTLLRYRTLDAHRPQTAEAIRQRRMELPVLEQEIRITHAALVAALSSPPRSDHTNDTEIEPSPLTSDLPQKSRVDKESEPVSSDNAASASVSVESDLAPKQQDEFIEKQESLTRGILPAEGLPLDAVNLTEIEQNNPTEFPDSPSAISFSEADEPASDKSSSDDFVTFENNPCKADSSQPKDVNDADGGQAAQPERSDPESSQAVPSNKHIAPPAPLITSTSFSDMPSGFDTIGRVEQTTIIELPPTCPPEKDCELPEGSEALWRLLENNDLPGAYWLCRSWQAANKVAPLPSWLIASVGGAQWLSPQTEFLIPDLMEIARVHVPDATLPAQLLALAAAFKPALLTTGSGFAVWLNAPTRYPHLFSLANTIREFAYRNNRALTAADLLGAAAPEQRAEELRAVCQQAQALMEEWGQRRFTYGTARVVWERLLRQELSLLLTPVMANKRTEVESVKTLSASYERLEQITQTLQKVSRELHLRHDQDIKGGPRDQMIRDLLDAGRLARRWCLLVQQAQESDQGGWFTDRVAQLRRDIEAETAGVDGELVDLLKSEDMSTRAAACCLQRAFVSLRSLLTTSAFITESATLLSGTDWCLNSFTQERSLYALPERSLYTALNGRLLLLPEIARADDGTPVDQSLPAIANLLIDSASAPPIAGLDTFQNVWEAKNKFSLLRSALREWGAKQDFRFTALLLTALQYAPDIEGLREEIAQQRNSAISDLKDRLARIRAEIEKALVDGVIVEEQHTRENANVEAIQVENVLNFPHVAVALDAIQQRLENDRTLRLEKQHALWQDLQSSLGQSAEPERWQRVCAFVQAAFDYEGPRVVDEALDHLREVRDRGVELDEDWIDGRQTRQEKSSRPLLEEFNQALLNIPEALERGNLVSVQRVVESVLSAPRAADTPRYWADIPFHKVPLPRLREATIALEQWNWLKRRGTSGLDAQATGDVIHVLLDFLGFTVLETPRIHTASVGHDWLHVVARLSPGEMNLPVPKFGSQANGNYDVLLLWDRPGGEAVRMRLKDLSAMNSILVFYLGRLKLAQRQDIARLARERELSLAVLDETMLVFLSAERDPRLRTFLRCTLPYAATNPYTPDKAGAVPPEMFFGRTEMITRLQDPNGSCLVYGGRQLGKSALLSHVKHTFHKPERHQYAEVELIEDIGDRPLAFQETQTLLVRLRDVFVRCKLLRDSTASKPETIASQIIDAMAQNPERRMLVMFDEADKFLDADSRDSFRIVMQLRRLMLQTNGRLKFVFAGLHHVQRFQGIPNHPLAQFGAPLLVGPLDPPAAQDLVRKPLQTLGFTLEDAQVLRILSCTNYHPGLIQKFCHALVRRMYERTRRTIPTSIEAADVEAVYLDAEVRRFIRERFELTLALDDRYQAVTYTLIWDQLSERDSYARPYTENEILTNVRILLPSLFTDIKNTHEMRSLLDEMDGLGVLVRTSDFRYRLRSPNLVRLMGTESAIEEKLQELANRPPRAQDDPDSLHIPLSLPGTHRRYSPLTHAQERQLNPRSTGVGLIFASDALGRAEMADAARNFLPPEMLNGNPPRAAFAIIPPATTGETEIAQWLRQQAEVHRSYERMVVFQEVSAAAPGLEKRVRGALNFCHEWQQSARASRLWMRVIFCFSPAATQTWLSLHSGTRDELEKRSDAALWPPRWNALGIRERLKQLNRDSPDMVRAIEETTSGWPWLLDRALEDMGVHGDPRDAATRLHEELFSLDSGPREEFLRRAGIHPKTIARQILQFVHQEQGAPRDLIVPEMLNGEQDSNESMLTEADCVTNVEYLLRMGCLQEAQDMWHVEPLLGRLLERG